MAVVGARRLVAPWRSAFALTSWMRNGDGNVIKLLWSNGDGLCLLAKRLEHERFVWPQATSGKVHLRPTQLSMLLERIAWKQPARTWSPVSVS